MAQAVGNDASLGVAIEKSTIDDVAEWFKSRVLTQDHIKELELEVETAAKASTGIPLIGSLFAKVTGSFKGGSKYREEIRQNIDKRPNELVEKVNVFLDAVSSALLKNSKSFQEILVFFDNLEKITNASSQVDQALISKASLFRQIRCKAIYTIPFNLLLTPGESGRASDAFILEMVPMVALREKNAASTTLDLAMKNAFVQVIEKRIDVNPVFESREFLDDILRYSGGCPQMMTRSV